jgi:hypothetical protein
MTLTQNDNGSAEVPKVQITTVDDLNKKALSTRVEMDATDRCNLLGIRVKIAVGGSLVGQQAGK